MTEVAASLLEASELPRLEAGVVRLRPPRADDAPALFAVFSDPKAMRYWSSLPWQERGEAERYLQQMAQGFAERSLFQWAVADVGSDLLLGTCTLFHLDLANRRAELGYILHPQWWGQGLMRGALTQLISYAFGELHLHRLEADVDPRNQGSLNLLKRLGFRDEGLLRQRWRVGDEWQDSQLLGLLAPDWRCR